MKRTLLLLFKGTAKSLVHELLTLAKVKADEDVNRSARLSDKEKQMLLSGMRVLERAIEQEIERKLS